MGIKKTVKILKILLANYNPNIKIFEADYVPLNLDSS